MEEIPVLLIVTTIFFASIGLAVCFALVGLALWTLVERRIKTIRARK